MSDFEDMSVQSCTAKAPFIAQTTQLDVELSCVAVRYEHFYDATQLDVELS